MKKIILVSVFCLGLFGFGSATSNLHVVEKKVIGLSGSISLINDTKEPVSIYTGTGFVTLNKGGKTSIGCNIGKSVCWAKEGKKGAVIFEIEAKHCGTTIKFSEFL